MLLLCHSFCLSETPDPLKLHASIQRGCVWGHRGRSLGRPTMRYSNPFSYSRRIMKDRPRAPTIPIRPPSSGPHAPEDQDSSLLHRMADGEELALADLYDRWSDRVHTVAFWILKDADDAEDVVEETFWQAWRSAARYDRTRSAASTWLMMIARSRALDRHRAERRRAEWTGSPMTAGALLDDAATRQPDTAAGTEPGEHSGA